MTYGSFAPHADGENFPERARVLSDFRAMRAAGLNTVRTYSLPPVDVLDTADEHGLRLVVGLHYDDWRGEPLTRRGHDVTVFAAADSEPAGDLVSVVEKGYQDDTSIWDWQLAELSHTRVLSEVRAAEHAVNDASVASTASRDRYTEAYTRAEAIRRVAAARVEEIVLAQDRAERREHDELGVLRFGRASA